MAILSKGTDFSTGDQVTAAKLDALVDNATFASDAVDNSTTALDTNGKIIVKDGGINSAKLASELTGKVKIVNNDTVFPNDLDGGLIQLSTSDASFRLSIDVNEFLANDNFTFRVFNGKNITFAQVNAAGDGSTAHVGIDSNGSLVAGKDTEGTSSKFIVANYAQNFGFGIEFRGKSGQSNYTPCLFENGSGSTVGSITNTNSATAFNTSSDYRLKEDIVEMQESIERVKELKPVNFAWKLDGTRVDGFLAHEAQEVVPAAVTGTKDAVDEDGQPDYQGIDQSKIVPLLTKALQEALTKIESLEARVAALES